LSTAGQYRWKTLTNISYTIGSVRAGIQWQHLPKIASGNTNTGLPAYDLFNFNSSYQINDKASVRFGVDNLFDKAPAFGGVNSVASGLTLPGGSYNTTNYDALGRRYYVGVTTKF
ncbi:MAG: hypothetical protein RLZZ08_2021, partial [Pseudomonadota bacterium]